MNRLFMKVWVFLMGTFVVSSNLVAQNLNDPLESMNTRVFDTIKLQKTNGEFTYLSEFKEAKGFIIVFTCNHCPFAKLYTERLNKLSQIYSKSGIPLVAINSMDTLLYEEEKLELMKTKEQSESFKFLYLKDYSQNFGRAFQAENTPQAFVVWKMNGGFAVKYKGAIDDNGSETINVKNPYVELALNELISNKRVLTPVTESFGCKIFYRSTKQ